MRFGVLAIDGCFDSGIVSVLDVLRTAAALGPVLDTPIAPITASTVGTEPTIRTAAGLTLDVDVPLDEAATACDVLVVPALAGFSPDEIAHQLQRPHVRSVIDALPELHHAGTDLAAACTGTFLAGDAGLLEDQRATTSWWIAPYFQQRFPNAELDMTAMVIRSPLITTAGAAFGHIDLALDLLARVSPDLASLASRYLVIDRRPAQSAYLVMSHLAAADTIVADFERAIRSTISEPLDVAAIANDLGVNRRTIERRVRSTTGLTPRQFATHIRLEHADHLRRTTNWTMDRIASEVGYSSAAALRRARTR